MPAPIRRAASHVWQPDIVVGIDFGMTCTGVVYSKLDSSKAASPDIRQIKRWPGSIDVLEKVPTEIIYSVDVSENLDIVQYWGAQCKHHLQHFDQLVRLFKLDVKASEPIERRHSVEEARRYLKDYVAQVVKYVDEVLVESIPRYKVMRVEYVFSVPTSWCLDSTTLNEVKKLIKDVVGESQERRARIGLTEAAAAAVESGRDGHKKGDVVLVCDTGGGTTDINIFKFLSTGTEIARIKALTYDEGADVGSTQIDKAAATYIESQRTGVDFGWDVDKAIRTDFAEIKHEYGKLEHEPTHYLLPVHDYKGNNEAPPPPYEFEVSDGTFKFKIPAPELRKWFDEQIDKIVELLQKQVDILHKENKREKLDRVVLSGGFALNRYYRDRLRKHFTEAVRAQKGGISPDLEILYAQEPHLAVVRGLVHNRVQELMGFGPSFEYVISPTSFGFVVSEEYSRRRHANIGEIPQVSMLDGKQWIGGQIDWVIEEGVPVLAKGMKKEYDLILNDEDEDIPRSFQVVSCDHPRRNLPKNINHNAVKAVCEVKIDLKKLSIVNQKSFHFNKSRSKTWREARFDLYIIIGAADLRFEVKPRGEEDSLISLEHDQIDVVWAQDDGGPMSRSSTRISTDIIVKRSSLLGDKASRLSRRSTG